MIGLECDRRVVARQCFVASLKQRQRHPAVGEREDIVGLDRQYLIETRQCLVEPLQLSKENAAVVECLCMLRTHGQGPLIRSDSVFLTPRSSLNHCQEVQGLVMVGTASKDCMAQSF